MALMGIDIGTTGVKCSIFDYEGKLCSFAYKEYGIFSPAAGYYELEPDKVWDAARYVIGKSMEGFRNGRIDVMSVSSLGEAAVPVDSGGNPLHNSLLYTDMRGKDQVDKIMEKLSLEDIMDITGLPAHSMYTLPKVMWFKENMPDIYKKASSFMLFGDYITYRLCGKALIDYSLASRTMTLNIAGKKWDKRMLYAAGIDREIFSTVVPAGTIADTIRPGLAEELGINRDALVVAGGHDQVCAAVGAGILRDGMAVNTMGTAECITPLIKSKNTSFEMLKNNFACVPYINKDTYVTYAFNFTGGSLVRWYRDNFGYRHIIEAEQTGKSPYSLLDSEVPGEPTNILVLPHFAGAGTPYMDTAARGAIIGLTLDVTFGMFYRALLEGVAYEMLYNIECLEESGIKIDGLRAAGGGAKSDIWLQIKADLMGRKIEKLDVDEAGTLGNIIIGGTAAGIYKSYEEAAERLIKVKKEFYPDHGRHELYKENYLRYRKIYDCVKYIQVPDK